MTDKTTIRIVVIALAVAAIGGQAAMALLVWSKVPAAELAVVAGQTGTAMGALAGVLISTRGEPQRVTVDQPPDLPVPVDPQGDTP